MAGKGNPRTGGRKKGSKNRLTVDVRDMVREALDRVGGVEYLVNQATLNPKAFMHLLARLIPQEIHAEIDPFSTLGEDILAARARHREAQPRKAGE